MKNGSEYCAYPPFIMAGKNGYLGHHNFQQSEIKYNDVINIEAGAVYKRYQIPMFNTIFLGDNRPEWLDKAYSLSRQTCEIGSQLLRPGNKLGEIYLKLKELLKDVDQFGA